MASHKSDTEINRYLVGGAVRDGLLGLKVEDRDWVVVGSTPEQMLELGYLPVGKDFPVFIDKESGEEFALARTERKTARGYQGFEFNASPDISLEQDLERRDITINAIAQDEQGNLIDPFGGLKDLRAGVIRHVSDAFIEDPVRVLRVARFAARFKFKVAPETLEFMAAIVGNGEVDYLVPERVWAEMKKALATDSPQIFFKVLRDCGALKKVLPEVDDLFGIPQTAAYHPEIDTGIHMLMVMEQVAKLSNDPLVRFAALVHDLGKARTPKEIWPSHRGHESGGIPIIKDLSLRLRIPKKYTSLALSVAEYHLKMHKMGELKPQTVLEMLRGTRCLNDAKRAEQIAIACTADARGRTGFEDRDYPQAELFIRYQKAVESVSSREVIAGLSDVDQIKAALHKAHLNAIKQIKREMKA